MKKHLICVVAAVIAIFASSFNSQQETTIVTTVTTTTLGYQWWDYNGGLLEQCDPAYYSPDSNNFPDCAPTLGLIYCEIYALPSAYDPSQPDLNTIMNYRMRPLL